jgi:hypothetical protein
MDGLFAVILHFPGSEGKGREGMEFSHLPALGNLGD